MESRFARRVMVTAMVVGLALSILYGLSGSHKPPGPTNPTATDIAK